ncbi:MAG: DUF4355 domain-containing protein [Clostridia bacterium]|nr:DUF4355 domain-containing protein [Clostridia bacterium]MBP3587432.1 DUF4355 domain-containing protein [Clostridia bacterium]
MEELLEKVEEITEETVEKPVEQPQPEQPPMEPPAPTTAQLEQELEELRKEKLHRLLMDEASMLLQERGIDPSFASFVLAEDSAATRKKVEQFDRRLADTLRKHLTDRLPVGEPKDFRAAKIPQRRRGIRKVS